MPEPSCWDQVRGTLAAWLRPLDWALVILIAGFVFVVAVIAVEASSGIGPYANYKRAIAAAAIKRPDYARTLKTIDLNGPAVEVVTVRSPGTLALEGRKREMWVALKSEAQAACKGATNPLLKLQQTFGLPPDKSQRVVTELEVAPNQLFRPCVAGGTISDPRCNLDFVEPPADQQKEQDKAKSTEAAALLKLTVKQMWESYRAGFERSRRGPRDYPDTGFPFTGMGWSYNWSNDSPDHFGATEFVILPNGKINKIVSEQSPAAFCAP